MGRCLWILSGTVLALLFRAPWVGHGFTLPPAHAAEPDQEAGTGSLPETYGGCTAGDVFFAEEVWAKVGERTCLKCHNADGDASDSRFQLLKQSSDQGPLIRNRAAFERMARIRKNGKSRLLLKVVGGLKHGGKEVLKPDSTGYRILERFVRRLEGKPDKKVDVAGYAAPPFYEGIRMITPGRLLRRVTLSLAGRLPSPEERTAVGDRGMEALDSILDGIMKEDAFYERLKEGFNDVFLTVGYEGTGEDALSYEHFQKTRLWYQKHDLTSKPEKDRKKARWSLAAVYRKALLREPMELIEYVVRNERPFTEIATADYIMVSPYTARGYGIFEKLRDTFKDPDDPFEYVPARLPALKRRNGKVQESPTGLYPHSGILTMFQYLRRYPTTVTNRNRLRARMYYRHFLGIDVMALAPSVTDAAAVAKKYENPTLEAPSCVVCHRTVDPLAGLFQDYFNEKGHYGPRKEGWFTDMFEPGHEETKLPKEERWRALQWLGEQTARDPRFPTAMVEHVYTILMGRKVLLPPEDIDDPMFGSKRRAYRVQRREIEEIAGRFAKENFNLKVAFKAWVSSPLYRVDGLAAATDHPRRQAELEDLGLVRLLTPEQLDRKLNAVFGQGWSRLDKQFRILYGGIDSKAVTERMTRPSGAMGAIQRIMSNDVACKTVPLDFSTEPSKRRLFPGIEPDVVPDDGPEARKKIRRAIVHLHEHVLGLTHAVDHPEVDRTYHLFAGILSDARARKGIEPRESYTCRGVDNQRLNDPKYTLRAWRGVVTYLLRQHDFLYE